MSSPSFFYRPNGTAIFRCGLHISRALVRAKKVSEEEASRSQIRTVKIKAIIQIRWPSLLGSPLRNAPSVQYNNHAYIYMYICCWDFLLASFVWIHLWISARCTHANNRLILTSMMLGSSASKCAEDLPCYGIRSDMYCLIENRRSRSIAIASSL